MKTRVLVTAIAVLWMTGTSNAASLSLSGTTTNQVLSGYNPNGVTGVSNGTTVSRLLPSNGLLPSGELYLNNLSDITFTYLGTEAGHKNYFNFNGSPIFDNKTWSVGSSYTVNNVGPGRLAFSFLDSNTGMSVANGLVGASLYKSIALIMESGGSWLALFNDDCSCDADFDDMVVRISAVALPNKINPVPIPAALPLLASGLGALGFIGWRRKRKGKLAAA